MALNLALYTETTGQTIGATEFSLTNKSTTIAAKTDTGWMSLFLDAVNMVTGDTFEVALQEKCISGGTQRRVVLARLDGAQNGPFIAPSLFLGVGWDFTVTKIAGTDRSFTWSIRSVT